MMHVEQSKPRLPQEKKFNLEDIMAELTKCQMEVQKSQAE